MVCGGDCSRFHSLEERVDQVGLGQAGVNQRILRAGKDIKII